MLTQHRWRMISRGSALVSVAVLAVFGVAWLRGGNVKPTPGPEFKELDEASSDAVVAYGRGLAFETVDGLSDTRRLSPQCDRCAVGPVATIQPEKGEYLVSWRDFAKGRIIARLINEDTVSAPRFGLAPGDTAYWWIDRRNGQWRSVFVPTRPGLPRVVGELIITKHQGLEWHQSLARWLWSADKEQGWSACGNRCCKSK